jgi:hypothetical protein
MKKLLMIFAAMFAMATVAFGQQAPAAPTPEPPRTTVIPKAEFTFNDCVTILRGLRGLDGYTTDKGNVQSYIFKNATLRGNIAENQARLANIPTEIENARQKIFSEIAKGAPEIPQTVTGDDKKEHQNPDFAEYSKQLVALGTLPCHVTLIHIKRDDLKLETNEIPGTTLADIDKILDK